MCVCVCGKAGHDKDGHAVYLEEIWPSRDENMVRIQFALILINA